MERTLLAMSGLLKLRWRCAPKPWKLVSLSTFLTELDGTIWLGNQHNMSLIPKIWGSLDKGGLKLGRRFAISFEVRPKSGQSKSKECH